MPARKQMFRAVCDDFHAPVLRFQSSDGQQLQCCLYYAVCLPVREFIQAPRRPFRSSLATHIPAEEGGTCNRSCQESSNLAQVLELTWAVTAAPGPDLFAPPPRNLQLASSRLRTIPMSQVVNRRGPPCLASRKSWQSEIECRQVLLRTSLATRPVYCPLPRTVNLLHGMSTADSGIANPDLLYP